MATHEIQTCPFFNFKSFGSSEIKIIFHRCLATTPNNINFRCTKSLELIIMHVLAANASKNILNFSAFI